MSSKPSVPNSLNEHWMPFTANKDFKANPRLIVEAKGVYLKNHQGQTQIDASSGLFCNPLGHGRQEIIDAITKQLQTLDYAQPFQQGFGGSFELATRISKHTPGNLNKIFYKNEKYPSKLKIFLWDKLFVPFTIILDFLTFYKMGKNIIVIIRKN